MSSGHKTMTAFLTTICGLILVITDLLMGWPEWLWPVLAALLLTGSVLTSKATARPRSPIPLEYTLEPDLPIPPQQRQEQRVTSVALPSAVEDYDFLFSAVVRWVPLETPPCAPHINPGGLAIEAVLLRAREVTAGEPPNRSTLVQHQLNGVLGAMVPDPSGRVLAMAENVALGLSEVDLDRLSKLAGVRKDEDVWEHERNYERNRRAYLSDDVLQNTGSAVVWWLAKNDEHIESAVERIGLLAQLSAAAHNHEVPLPFRHLAPSATPPPSPQNGDQVQSQAYPTAHANGFQDTHAGLKIGTAAHEALDGLMGWLGLSPDDPEFPLLADRLARVIAAAGKDEKADEIRQLFDVPATGTADTEKSPEQEERTD